MMPNAPALLLLLHLQGYNATVLAYGQTGSGKTLTMSGGTGIHGMRESGEQLIMVRVSTQRGGACCHRLLQTPKLAASTAAPAT
jgi:hypothetical protein